MNSKFFNLNLNDLGKGSLMAAGTAILVVLEPMLAVNKLPDLVTLKAAGISGLAAGIFYLLKNLVTNSRGKMLKTEPGPEGPPVVPSD
jgi:hypothetical protein